MFMSPAQQTRTVPSLSIPGRQHEIGRLQAAWELCRNGRGGVVTLHGPVGVGRTELLDAFGEFADSDGAQVLRAMRLPAGAGLPARDRPPALPEPAPSTGGRLRGGPVTLGEERKAA